jgi:hypothetical protein
MTLGLLRLLESSDASFIDKSDDEVKRLYDYSVKNRMPSPFLHRISGVSKTSTLQTLLIHEQNAYWKMLEAVGRVSGFLSDANIRHATFKTIRPYRSTTVDIDTVIFGDHGDYRRAFETMKSCNYPLLAVGPMSSTFWDSTANMGIDLYDEIAVSLVCYINKDILDKFVRSITLPNGKKAMLLAPEADLLAIVAHSIIKEQMYTLSEYYSFINYLERMNTKTFIDLIRKTNLTGAVKTHASITTMLFRAVHGNTPKKLEDILGALGEDHLEMSRMSRRDLESPHKYHPITIGRSFLEITKGNKTRKSIALQVYRMTNLRFTRKFLDELLQHLVRETY